MDKIGDFIKRHWDEIFRREFFIYFKAKIPILKIYYLPIIGHFCVGYENNFYDWTGKISLNKKTYSF